MKAIFLFFLPRKRLLPIEYKGFRLVPTTNSIFVFSLKIPQKRTSYRAAFTIPKRSNLTTYEESRLGVEEVKRVIDKGEIKQ